MSGPQHARSRAIYHFLPIFAGAFLAGIFAAACGWASGFAVADFLAEDAGGIGAFRAAAFGAGFLSDVWVSAEALTVLISRGVRDRGFKPFRCDRSGLRSRLFSFSHLEQPFGIVSSSLTGVIKGYVLSDSQSFS